MDVDKEIKELKQHERGYANPLCCCWPSDAYGAKLWGIVLVGIGSIWLLSNLGVSLSALWPLLFIGLGFYYVIRSTGNLTEP